MNKLKDWLNHPRLPVALALLAIVLTIPSLWTGLQFDDFLQRLVHLESPVVNPSFRSPFRMFDFANGDPDRAQEFMDLGWYPWWTLPNVMLTFWRPVTVLSHMLDYRLWPDNFPLMHLHNLLWYAAGVAAVVCFYRRIIGAGWVAGLAGLLFAIDDAHSIPVSWIANRNGLMALFFGIMALLFHDRWRRDTRRLSAAIALLFLLAGLLSGEAAIATGAYLVAYALIIDKGNWRARTLSLVPYGAVIVVWRVFYRVLGYGASGSEFYVDPLKSPLHFLSVLWQRAVVLLQAQWGPVPSELQTMVHPPLKLALWAVSLLFLIWVFSVLAPLIKKNRTAQFWTLGMVLSVVPVCAAFPMDRLLMFAGVGAMGLLALFIDAAREGYAANLPSVSRQKIAKALYIFLIFLHLIIAPVLLPVKILGFAMIGNRVNDWTDSIPLDDAQLAGRTLVVPYAPSPFVSNQMAMIRANRDTPLPAHFRVLSPNMWLPLIQSMDLTRTDDRTLVVEPEGGFHWFLVRDNEHEFRVSDEIKLTGMTVRILTLTEDNYPKKVEYRFDRPLEDPSFLWWLFEDYKWEPFTLPAVGETIKFNP